MSTQNEIYAIKGFVEQEMTKEEKEIFYNCKNEIMEVVNKYDKCFSYITLALVALEVQLKEEQK